MYLWQELRFNTLFVYPSPLGTLNLADALTCFTIWSPWLCYSLFNSWTEVTQCQYFSCFLGQQEISLLQTNAPSESEVACSADKVLSGTLEWFCFVILFFLTPTAVGQDGGDGGDDGDGDGDAMAMAIVMTVAGAAAACHLFGRF